MLVLLEGISVLEKVTHGRKDMTGARRMHSKGVMLMQNSESGGLEHDIGVAKRGIIPQLVGRKSKNDSNR